jgi:hypothetical protein
MIKRRVGSQIELENFRQGLQLCFRPDFNWRFTHKVMGLQSHGNPNFKNFETPNLEVQGQNDIWVLALWPSIKNIIRGKVMASFKSKPW